MLTLFIILIILACVVLCMIVLVQNPKGGGLAGNIAGFSNQFMGVKQTTDVLEKGTWVFAGVIALLCITSSFFIRGRDGGDDPLRNVNTTRPVNSQPQGSPANTAPFQNNQQPAPATNDTNRR